MALSELTCKLKSWCREGVIIIAAENVAEKECLEAAVVFCFPVK